MATRGAQQALVSGRVVTVRHRASGLSELGVVCGTAAAGASRQIGLLASSGSSAAAGAVLVQSCQSGLCYLNGGALIIKAYIER